MKKVAKPDMRPMHEKTLDELEGVVWGPATYDSHLVRTAHRLRTKPIGQFGTEDLRLMIGQKIGLSYLLPLALDQLESNRWASGDMYPGDLLKMVAVSKYQWASHPEPAERFRTIALRALADIPVLRHDDPDGMPNLDVPGEELAAELGEELRRALAELG